MIFGRNLSISQWRLKPAIITLVAVLLCALWLFSGCSKKSTNADAALVGSWKLTQLYYNDEWHDIDNGGIMTFYSNKTGVMGNDEEEAMEFTWSISGDNLTITIDGENETALFSINGDTMIITTNESSDIMKAKYIRI